MGLCRLFFTFFFEFAGVLAGMGSVLGISLACTFLNLCCFIVLGSLRGFVFLGLVFEYLGRVFSFDIDIGWEGIFGFD